MPEPVDFHEDRRALKRILAVCAAVFVVSLAVAAPLDGNMFAIGCGVVAAITACIMVAAANRLMKANPLLSLTRAGLLTSDRPEYGTIPWPAIAGTRRGRHKGLKALTIALNSDMAGLNRPVALNKNQISDFFKEPQVNIYAFRFADPLERVEAAIEEWRQNSTRTATAPTSDAPADTTPVEPAASGHGSPDIG